MTNGATSKRMRERNQELEDTMKMLPTWVTKLWAPFRPSSSPVLNKNITACLNPAHWEIPRASSNITAIHELQSPAPSLEHPWKLFWSNKVGFGIYKDIFASRQGNESREYAKISYNCPW
jgi:hypothetical protein